MSYCMSKRIRSASRRDIFARGHHLYRSKQSRVAMISAGCLIVAGYGSQDVPSYRTHTKINVHGRSDGVARLQFATSILHATLLLTHYLSISFRYSVCFHDCRFVFYFSYACTIFYFLFNCFSHSS